MNINSDHLTSTVPSEGRISLPPLPAPYKRMMMQADDVHAEYTSEQMTSYGNAVWRAAMLHAAEIAGNWPQCDCADTIRKEAE